MDRLPADAENLLKSLIYMQGDASEIDMSPRFEKLTMRQAQDEVLVLELLKRRGYVDYCGSPLSKEECDGGWEEIARGVHSYTPVKHKEVRYHSYVIVTPMGASYFRERNRSRASTFWWTVLAAALGGLFAWVFSCLLPG